jgi:hypothetical protein
VPVPVAYLSTGADTPEQIAGPLKGEFPDRPEMQGSAETIHQSLYVQSRGALEQELIDIVDINGGW